MKKPMDEFFSGEFYFREGRSSGHIPAAILDFSEILIHGPMNFIPSSLLAKSKGVLKTETRSLTTEEWLDSVEAAAYLKVTLGALRNMTSNGQVPFYKVGNRNRYRTEELRTLLLSHKRGARYGN